MFRSCPRKFFWKYILRLRPRGDHDGNLAIGSAFHHCLGRWYQSPERKMAKIASKPHKNLETLLRSGTITCREQQDYDKFESVIETFVGMMEAYEHLYQDDRASWYVDPDCVEKVFTVNCGDFDFAGKVDLAASPSRKVKRPSFIMEHKTASRMSAGEAYLSRLELDTQVRGYIFGAQHGLGLSSIKEVLYDVVVKCQLRRKSKESQQEFCARIKADYISRPEHYFHREPLLFSPSDIGAFELEMRQTHRDYLAIVGPLDKAYRRAGGRSTTVQDFVKMLSDTGLVPALELAINPSDPRAWRPDDSTCNDYFRLCEYFPLCTGGLTPATARQYEQRDTLHEELADA